MPRKSKAQKIRADRIRKNRQIHISVEPLENRKQATIQVKPVLQDPQERLTTVATKKDLIKTLLIVASIFALEFTIFYATLK
ncbi:hypothetical protein A2690_04780 [Candidatus Roizmanbacteria bacterium RIFCSPHIGHO2_01_FULL_39_12b]|uniref:Uncharacterized protein n=1 Tax=Candidatus Roizmanbacteria bacterium RIFCSPHIGHO2_01_FULL_39_12b TaxID=1802030 RepID=A0A1F7GDM7_9BACT|nr:MAG: hypothetical protein A2690_04780 [Candidatus Roizmanbacteria bacterium RIFCSPHIGHO2_01_FULL_39_12b]OGK46063.1 MAG: hypothetical protein A3B46_00910 [Candidatus Roizmanbacteria bacterium RIFCSPLOWO2_01_FULL_39_19]